MLRCSSLTTGAARSRRRASDRNRGSRACRSPKRHHADCRPRKAVYYVATAVQPGVHVLRVDARRRTHMRDAHRLAFVLRREHSLEEREGFLVHAQRVARRQAVPVVASSHPNFDVVVVPVSPAPPIVTQPTVLAIVHRLPPRPSGWQQAEIRPQRSASDPDTKLVEMQNVILQEIVSQARSDLAPAPSGLRGTCSLLLERGRNRDCRARRCTASRRRIGCQRSNAARGSWRSSCRR